jgi:membrane fusion protein, multidrug efflux system
MARRAPGTSAFAPEFPKIPMRQLLCIATVSIAMVSACSKKPEGSADARGPGGPVPVNVGKAVTKDIPFELRAIGNVESMATVGIKAQVGGELISVDFKEGEDVKKGDLLFSIQPKLYATQLAQAEANVARDRVAAANTLRDAQRQEELGRKGVASKEQLDASRAAADAAEATVKADEALVEIARVRLGYATIEAPISGRTGALRVQAGNIIKENADDPMVIIRQISPIYVSFSVPEQYLAEVRANSARAKLAVTALDAKNGQRLAEGELTFIENTVDMTTGTVTLKGTFANEDRALWPGAFVDVRLRLRVEAGVTVVPSSAVTVGQRGTQIFVIKDNKAELRPVTVRRNVGDETIIEAGVQSGEIVVTNGQSRLVPGASVNIKPSTDASATAGAGNASAAPTPAKPRSESGG